VLHADIHTSGWIHGAKESIDCLEGHGSLSLSHFHGEYYHHGVSSTVPELKFDISFDIVLAQEFCIMDEGLSGICTIMR
jgi:hypothetical protein